MRFAATEAFEPLAYDFAPYGGSGVTPEPSQGLMDALVPRIRAIAQEVGVDPARAAGLSPQELAEQVAGSNEDNFARLNEQMLDVFADLCQGHPSREEIEALPFRVQQAFMGWLLRELTDPSGPTRALRP